MKLGLINSAFAQAGKGTRFGLEQTKRLGFDSVDLLADPLVGWAAGVFYVVYAVAVTVLMAMLFLTGSYLDIVKPL